MARRAPFAIGEEAIAPGEARTIDLPVSVLSNHTPIALPVHVVHGRREGPTLFVSAAVHGDEIIGVEIIRRLLRAREVKRLRGTLLCVPIVNAFGFISHTRYLPDRRDLNRSFPGNQRGSLAAQLAHLFLTEIVKRADVGIDLHSAAHHRINLPQLRVSSTQPRLRELAYAFGAPVVVISRLREGSMREAAQDEGVDVMVYEGGEGLRFDEFAIRAGVKGVLRVMGHLEMVNGRRLGTSKVKPMFTDTTAWVRAPAGGVLRAYRTIGEIVSAGETIGVISDPFGESETEIQSSAKGLIIGRTNLPVVNQGDALFHIAQVGRSESAERAVDRVEQELLGDPLFDEDEIL